MAEAPLAEEAFEGWAVLEIMGHRRVAGLVRSVTMFGAPMCRVDVPFADKDGVQVTQFYGGASIFCLTPTTEEQAKRLAPRPFVEPVLAQLPEPDENDWCPDEDEDEDEPG